MEARAFDLELQAAVQLHTQGRLAEARARYEALLARDGRHGALLGYLGTLCGQLGDVAAAVGHLERAAALVPDSPMVLANLGTFLVTAGRTDDALDVLDRALDLERRRPTGTRTEAGLWGRIGSAHKAAGDMGRALEAFRRSNELGGNSWSNLLYTMPFCPGVTAEEVKRAHLDWASRLPPAPPRRRPRPEDDPRPDRPLRVGFVAPDFREHCQSLFTVPLFTHLDRARVEVTCYSDVQRPDAVTARLEALVPRWRRTVGWPDARLAQQVRDDRIDVLVDLTLHMAGSRLGAFLSRPAPVQVTWLGYPGTTGLGCIDHRLTDPHIDPPGNDSFYVEPSWRLPDTFWCYDPLATGPDPGPLPALEGGGVTFGCLNNFAKVNEPLLALWARVLAAVPGSRLVLLAAEGSRRDWVRACLAREGVAGGRVEFVPRVARADYLATYRRIDVGLDTFPVNGHTTSLDATWMGVPVVTMPGRHALGRAGVCLMENLGLQELVAPDEAAFVETCARLAGDLPRLAGLRATLRGRLERSPLMDGPRFARAMEGSLAAMWRAFCEGEG